MTIAGPVDLRDPLDQHLLAMLRADSRQPVAQLAKALAVPRSQLYARLARLEDAGIVNGYTIRLGSGFVASRVRAHVMIKTLPRCHREVETALIAIAQVTAVHAISGEYDVIAQLEAGDAAELNDLIDLIGMLDGVERTNTSVILATKLER